MIHVGTSLENPLPNDVPVPARRPAITDVEKAVNRYYGGLLPSVKACLAVFGTMVLKGRTKPLSLIFESTSGYGKTANLQMTFPLQNSGLDQHVYRSDKFTPKSFVSHAANTPGNELSNRDLLPRVQNKVLVTKELTPIFRGKPEEVKDNFSMLISILDGKGFTSDSGMRGKRGYEESILFNWVGATTPLPRDVHRMMYQLGTRLLFYEIPSVAPTEAQLLEYARREDAGEAENECQRVVNRFLVEFYKRHPIGSVSLESISIPEELLFRLTQWANFVAKARTELKYEQVNKKEWEAVGAAKSEGPWKLINYFKELARGHALIHERSQVDESDLALVGHTAISSIPGYLRPIIRELTKAESCKCMGDSFSKYET